MIKQKQISASGLRILNLMQRENKFSYLIDRYLFLFSAQILFNFSENNTSTICILHLRFVSWLRMFRYLNGKTTKYILHCMQHFMLCFYKWQMSCSALIWMTNYCRSCWFEIICSSELEMMMQIITFSKCANVNNVRIKKSFRLFWNGVCHLFGLW